MIQNRLKDRIMSKHLGRPSKYRPIMVEKAKQYYKDCLDQDKIPYIEELSRILSVYADKISEYSKLHQSFHNVIRNIKDLQRNRLNEICLGLRKGNVIGAIFLLKVLHSYVETTKSVQEGIQPTQVKVDLTGGYIPMPTSPLKPLQDKKPLIDN